MTVRSIVRKRALAAVSVTALMAAGLIGSATAPAFASTTMQAENGSYGGVCGDNQVENTRTAGDGSTTVFMGGAGCIVTFSTSTPLQVNSLRWYGGGQAGSVCGTFILKSGGTVISQTGQTCSVGGATPDDWQNPAFSSPNTVPVGTFQVVWQPNVYWLDANLDSISVDVVPGAQCEDGVDNDGDGWTDYPNDPGCTGYTDNTESPNPPVCSDGKDNDGDGRVDYPADPGCASSTGTAESPDPQCGDRIDNDGDGNVDYPNDPGCASPRDTAEGPSCQPQAPGVLVCLEPTTEVTRATAMTGDVPDGPTHTVLGYVDFYRFNLPASVSVTIPCVVLTADATTGDACASAGGVFQNRELTLVEQDVTQPNPTLVPLTSVGICNAELTLLVVGAGINSAPGFTTC